MEMAKDYTDIIGGHGRFQLTILIFCFFCAAPYSMHQFSITFFAPNLDYWCSRPEEVLQANISVDEWRNFSIPIIKSRSGIDEFSHCTVFNSSIENGLLYHQNYTDPVKCNSWEYDHSSQKRTIIDEWDLVCDREWLVGMSKTVFMLGVLFGSLINGQLSDRFGRRKIVIFCIILFLIFGFLTLLSASIIIFLVCRFFIGFGIASVFVNSPVILSEIVSSEYRTIYCFTYGRGLVLTFILMPLISWLIPNWFWLHLIFTLPWISLLCVFWVLPETPVWLLANGKFSELEELLLYAAKKNRKDMQKAKIEISDYIAHHSQEKLMKEDKDEKASVLDLLRPTIRKNTIIIFFCWFINSYNYYVLSWNTNDFGGDPYWSFFFSGIVEIPEMIIYIFLCRRVGNRWGLAIANVMSGIFLVALVCIPAVVWVSDKSFCTVFLNIKMSLGLQPSCKLLIHYAKDTMADENEPDNDMKDKAWLKILFSVCGIFFSVASFDTNYVYTSEIFPTVMRNTALGSGSTVARIGALLSPFVHQLGDMTYPWVPIAVPGVLSIMSGFLILLLPETKGKTLSDTLTQEEAKIFQISKNGEEIFTFIPTLERIDSQQHFNDTNIQPPK